MRYLVIILLLVLPLTALRAGANLDPAPGIHYDTDPCAECNMIISDLRFACGCCLSGSESLSLRRLPGQVARLKPSHLASNHSPHLTDLPLSFLNYSGGQQQLDSCPYL